MQTLSVLALALLVASALAAPAASSDRTARLAARRAGIQNAQQAAMAAEAAPLVDVDRRDTYVLSASYVGAINDWIVNINMFWDHNQQYKYDLDQLLLLPNGCVLGMKTVEGGVCLFDNEYGAAYVGGPIDTNILRSDYNQYQDSLEYLDSTGGTNPSYLRGVESFYLDTPDLGFYRHLVYAFGSTEKFTSAQDAKVRVYIRNPSSPYGAYQIYGLDQPSTSCYGKFWNTFAMTITQIEPILANFTTVNTITTTPSTFLGTTDLQEWEYTYPYGTMYRPSTNC